MDLSLQTWNSLNINDGSPFLSWFPIGSKTNLNANPITVNRAGDYPALSGIVLPANILVIGVRIAAGQDLDTNREKVKQYFDTDGIKHTLVAYDADNSNAPMYVSGYVIGLAPEGGAEKQAFVVRIAVEYPYWRLVTAATATAYITSSGQTFASTNSGNKKVPPVFAITPTTAASDGLKYRRWVAVYNNTDAAYTDAMDITAGGIDTATLTTSKMQADGDDFRVWVDGVETDRWLDAMDTAATKCWVNMQFAPRREGAISATVANTTGATTVTFSRTRDNLAFLQAMKRVSNRVLLIDSEALTFSAANVDTYNYQITSCARAKRGTSAATHTIPKTARWIEHDIWICYGDSSLSAPDVDDANKPMFTLSSTNTARAYTQFYDSSSDRPGAWTPGVQATKSNLSYTYTANQGTFANPATELGVALVGSDGFRVMNEVGTVSWTYTHPAGVTNVLYSGDKYCTTNGAGSFPVVCGLQYLEPDAVWFTQQTEAAPLLGSVWEAFGPNNETLGDTYEAVRFALDGTLDSTASARAMAQFDTVTVTLDSNNLPTITVGAEQACYELNATIANNTTGESLRCNVPMGLNETLTIDCEAKTVTNSTGSRAVLTFSTDREAWLDMAVGVNTFAYTDTGTAAVTVQISHRDRTI